MHPSFKSNKKYYSDSTFIKSIALRYHTACEKLSNCVILTSNNKKKKPYEITEIAKLGTREILLHKYVIGIMKPNTAAYKKQPNFLTLLFLIFLVLLLGVSEDVFFPSEMGERSFWVSHALNLFPIVFI
ncbi:UNVERIFIED_CONTAM: hypothetical protein NCL1_39900 [Trichonephila clavipes]